MTPATFYIVNGPRGVYYAVRNHHSGKVWTERTELAAHQQAQDEGLAIINSQEIRHTQLLDLMLAYSPAPTPTTKPAPAESARPSVHLHGGLSRFLKRFRRDSHPSDHGR